MMFETQPHVHLRFCAAPSASIIQVHTLGTLLLTSKPLFVLSLAHSSAVTCCKRKAILGIACFSDIM